jgi:hypothetical protein
MTSPAIKHTPEELALRAEAVRQATGSLALEGLVVSPEVAELDRRYILGEISLDEKLELIKKLYNHK